MSRSRKAVLGSGFSLLQFAVTMGLQLALAPAVIKYAGDAALGAYAVLMQAVGYLSLLDLGFSVAFNRHLSRATAKEENDQEFMAVMASGAWFVGATNLASAALLAAGGVFLESLIDVPAGLLADARWGVMLLALWTAARTPFVVRAAALLARQDLAFRHSAATAATIIRLVGSLIAVQRGYGLLGMMAAVVMAEAVDGILCTIRWAFVRPRAAGASYRPDMRLLMEILSFGSHALLINVAVRMVFYSDTMIVGGLCGASAASVYYTTQAAAALGWAFVWRVTDSAGPGINQMWAAGNMAALRSAYLRLHSYALGLGMLLFTGLVFLNQEFVSLWVGTKQYGGAVMNVAIAAFALTTIVSHLDSMFRLASGEVRQLSRLAVVEGVAHVTLAALLTIWIGPTGVAVAGLVPHLGITAYLNRDSRHAVGVPLRTFVRGAVAPALVASACSTACLVAAQWFICPAGWGSFAAVVGIAVVVHMIAMGVVVLHECERRLVTSMVDYSLAFVRRGVR